MKKLFLSTAIAALCIAMPAAAQDQGQGQGQGDQHHHDQGNGAQGGQQGPAGAGQGGAGGQQGPAGANQGGAGAQGGGDQSDKHDQDQSHDHDTDQNHATGGTQGRPSDWRGYENNHRTNTNMHVNIRLYQRNITAPRRFHWGTYHPPQGYYVHRWHYGERLPPGFFARDYWVTDFWTFGLMEPPPGLVWVRVGDDALLIDENTGEVIQVDYGVFY